MILLLSVRMFLLIPDNIFKYFPIGNWCILHVKNNSSGAPAIEKMERDEPTSKVHLIKLSLKHKMKNAFSA